jgi:inner membrane protein
VSASAAGVLARSEASADLPAVEYRPPRDHALENLTHSLVGAALAELALPAGAASIQRRVLFTVGIVAANLPDADLLYTRITPPPLGYLLHHRGHTHTLVGLAAQALLIGAVCLLPVIRRNAGALWARLMVLIAVGLLSHLVLDSWNSYGVHPFWPFDIRWYYGDAIYILEPWLWVLLGVAATLNTRQDWGRILLGVTLAVLASALAWLGMIPRIALVALAVVALALAVLARSWPARRRSGAALLATALFVLTMFVVRERVRDRVRSALDPGARANLVDIVLSPQAANPLCWSVLAIVKAEPSAEYLLTRGTATAVLPSGCGADQLADVAWSDPVHQSLRRLRELVREDCPVRAWMQFGRAPEISDHAIGDLRYGGATRDNFSMMALTTGGHPEACPPHLTHWGMPRADLLAPAAN